MLTKDLLGFDKDLLGFDKDYEERSRLMLAKRVARLEYTRSTKSRLDWVLLISRTDHINNQLKKLTDNQLKELD